MSMTPLAADENLNGHIVVGVRRRLPTVDLVRVQDAGLSGADDPEILEWCAGQGRVLLTHDADTMTEFSYEKANQCRASSRSVMTSLLALQLRTSY